MHSRPATVRTVQVTVSRILRACALGCRTFDVIEYVVTAHRVPKIVGPDERNPVHAGELHALIRIDQPRCLGLRRHTALCSA